MVMVATAGQPAANVTLTLPDDTDTQGLPVLIAHALTHTTGSEKLVSRATVSAIGPR